MRFTIEHRFDVAPEVIFDFTNDARNFTSFTGFGPIPGIVRASYITPGEPALGSRRTILKTDGTEHVEEIVVFDRPHRHTSRITGFAPPFSRLVRSGEDDWVFHADGNGTRVERTFSFELTSPLVAPIAWLILHAFMAAAVRRDLRNIAQAAARSVSG